jgi:GNAT superfamily N-acetyltransferase
MSGSFKIRDAKSEDVAAALVALGEAFAQDPLMLYLFGDHPKGVRAGAMEFFSILLRARIALAMPAYVLEHDGAILGAAMGYDASRPTWPAPLTGEWERFEAALPGLGDRLAAYESICTAHQPEEDHYYLGVIGVHPSLQGKGAGKALLDAFCAPSQTDARSGGVYLDTTNPDSLQFYYKNGFALRGEGDLDGAPVWCVYKRT